MEKGIKVLTLEDIKKGCEFKCDLNWFYEYNDFMSDYNLFKMLLDGIKVEPLYFLCRENINVVTSVAKDSPDWFIKTYGGVRLPLKQKWGLDSLTKTFEKHKDELLKLGGNLTKEEVTLLRSNSYGKKQFIDVDGIHKGVFRYSLMQKIASLREIIEGGDEILCVIYP